jgi:hypothetical protein
MRIMRRLTWKDPHWQVHFTNCFGSWKLQVFVVGLEPTLEAGTGIVCVSCVQMWTPSPCTNESVTL